MTVVQNRLFAKIHKLASANVTDRDLIERFRNNDSDAFGELVTRYAPMVLDVCRRVLPSWHDAEDACQAVFVILAKKAHSGHWNPSIANWLYTTARHVAFRANRANARRFRHESQAIPRTEGVSVLDQMTGREVLLALDGELEHLARMYREPLVLCCLVGLSREEAAGRLGCSPGSLKARLERGRKRLAEALSRRGIGPAVALLTTGVASRSGACPTSLLKSILAAVAGTRSAVADRLACEFLKTGIAAPAKAWTLAVVAMMTLGFGFIVRAPSTDTPLQFVSKPIAEKKEVREGEIVVWQKGHAVLFKPDGTKSREWKNVDVTMAGGARLSPDGKTIAIMLPYETRVKNQKVAIGGGGLLGTFSRHLFRVTLYPVQEKLNGTDLEIPGDSVEKVLWSADGAKLYVATHADDEDYSHEKELKHFVFEVSARKTTELKLPPGHHLIDVSPDGKHFLTKGPGAKPNHAQRACLVSASGGEPVGLSEPNEAVYDGHFSPDGKTVLLTGFRSGPAPIMQPGGGVAAPGIANMSEGWLVTLPVDTPRKRTVLPLKDREYANQCRWSPDGKRIVTARQVLPEFNKQAPQLEIVITDADGKNRKLISDDTGRHLDPVMIDWR